MRIVPEVKTGPWHLWFAWFPVDTVTHGWRWLRPVERRLVQSEGSMPMGDPLPSGTFDRAWQYRIVPVTEASA